MCLPRLPGRCADAESPDGARALLEEAEAETACPAAFMAAVITRAEELLAADGLLGYDILADVRTV